MDVLCAKAQNDATFFADEHILPPLDPQADVAHGGLPSRDRQLEEARSRRRMGVPVLHAQAGLTKDRAQNWHGNVAGMHRDSDSTAVWKEDPRAPDQPIGVP